MNSIVKYLRRDPDTQQQFRYPVSVRIGWVAEVTNSPPHLPHDERLLSFQTHVHMDLKEVLF